MIDRIPFTSRRFEMNSQVGIYPCLVERLRGTPARLEEMLVGFPREVLAERPGNKWSVLQEVGHLWMADHYFEQRLLQILEGRPELAPVKLDNPEFDEDRYQRQDLSDLARCFRHNRAELIERYEDLDEPTLRQSSVWTDLNLAMRVIDHFWFVAEHDDAHLAAIYQLKCRLAK